MCIHNILDKKFFVGLTSVMFASVFSVVAAYADDVTVLAGTAAPTPTLSATSECGDNLFNPILLNEADFNITYTNSSDITDGFTATGPWNQYFKDYVAGYSFGFSSNAKYKVSYTIRCADNTTGGYYFALKLANGQLVGPNAQNNNVCTGQTDTDVDVEFMYDGDQPVVGLVAVGPNASANVTVKDIMVTLADMDTQEYIPYDACIRIATTKSNELRAQSIENRLTDVRGIITGLITKSQQNTAKVDTLQSEKQTRPDEFCPQNKTCLLVKDRNNVEHWYEIIECNEFNMLDAGNFAAPAFDGSAQSFGYRYNSGQKGFMCTDTDAGCNNDMEWVSSYDDGLVYGTARRVAITEHSAGKIVTMPNNVQTGHTCACLATRYRELDTANNTYGTSVPVSTDKWLVVGDEFDDDSNLNEDGDCLAACARFDVDANSRAKRDYYKYIANSCMGTPTAAVACSYNSFLESLSNSNTVVATSGQSNGSADNGGIVWGACAQNGIFENTDHCTVDANGSDKWIAQYSVSGTPTGYVYGIGGYMTLSNAQQGTLVNADMADIDDSEVGHNAAVCVVTGFKAAGDASETNISVRKAYVVAYNTSLPDDVATTCAEVAESKFDGLLYPVLARLTCL